MELPAITLPKIDLPFDIPVLLHPAVDHFAIALPVIILLLELINLVARKRTVSVLSLFFIVLTVLAVVAAYFSGSVDAKEAFDALGEAGQDELKDHKLLGTYLMIASGLLLLLKLLSMMIGRALMQAFYLLFVVVFVAGMLNQGKEGGELVYEHGANVEKVKSLDEKVFDLEEALEESSTEINASSETDASPKTNTSMEANQTEDAPTETPATETAPAAPVEATTPPVAVPSEMNKEVAPTVNEKAEILKVEGMPEEMVQPQIATH